MSSISHSRGRAVGAGNIDRTGRCSGIPDSDADGHGHGSGSSAGACSANAIGTGGSYEEQPDATGYGLGTASGYGHFERGIGSGPLVDGAGHNNTTGGTS